MVDYFSELRNFSYTHKDKDLIIKLLMTGGIGNKSAAYLLYCHKKHEDSCGELMGIRNKYHINKRLMKVIINDTLEQKICSLKKQLIRDKISQIFFWEDDYPMLLKQTDDFPLILFIKGNQKILNFPSLAVVGTRKVTSYGRQVTRKLVRELIDYKYTIISGCMYGVDEIAHQEVIDHNANTVAVLGYGFNYVYPLRLKGLQKKIIDCGGCLVSEFFPDIKPSKWTFPQRNRIVAGMSLGVIVTQAAINSGTHITVRFSLDAGREVFAVCGSIFDHYNDGTMFLVNQGAKLVSSGEDVVAEL